MLDEAASPRPRLWALGGRAWDRTLWDLLYSFLVGSGKLSTHMERPFFLNATETIKRLRPAESRKEGSAEVKGTGEVGRRPTHTTTPRGRGKASCRNSDPGLIPT